MFTTSRLRRKSHFGKYLKITEFSIQRFFYVKKYYWIENFLFISVGRNILFLSHILFKNKKNLLTYCYTFLFVNSCHINIRTPFKVLFETKLFSGITLILGPRIFLISHFHETIPYIISPNMKEAQITKY